MMSRMVSSGHCTARRFAMYCFRSSETRACQSNLRGSERFRGWVLALVACKEIGFGLGSDEVDNTVGAAAGRDREAYPRYITRAKFKQSKPMMILLMSKKPCVTP